MSSTFDSPLFALQRTLYSSSNYTRRRSHQNRFRWIRDAILNYSTMTSGELALEFGPGSGVYLPILAKCFRKVVGADIEAAYLQGIRTNEWDVDNLSLVTDDILNSRLENESFDLILCSEVLEHVTNPKTALRTVFRVLKPGGIAVVTTPQKYSVLELCCKIAFLPGIIQIVRNIYAEPVIEAGHISLMTRKQFKLAVQQVGFETLQEEQLSLYVPLLAEFFGDAGGRLIEKLEYKVVSLGWKALLWTQSYVLRKPA